MLLRKPNRDLTGTITLDGSKSISNRMLIMQALAEEEFNMQHLSTSQDTRAMQQLLQKVRPGSGAVELNAGPAGTVFRFLTAFLAIKEGTWILMGSERMKQRPIKPLVDALEALGANITYAEKEGFPPLKIKGHPLQGGKVSIDAGISSQFISALLMIAPYLENGLTLQLEGTLVSKPYIELTLRLMQHFGVNTAFINNTIQVFPQRYQPKPIQVEADWSAASYYYAMAAFAQTVDLRLNGCFQDSWQGDSAIQQWMEGLGVMTTATPTGIHLSKGPIEHHTFEQDFTDQPDLLQTMAVIGAGLGIPMQFTGVDHLRIKETDRLAALQKELGRLGLKMEEKEGKWSLHGEIDPERVKDISINTYNDHRMAMAFAPLALRFGQVGLQDHRVVEKSYPQFWEHLRQLGFQLEEVER